MKFSQKNIENWQSFFLSRPFRIFFLLHPHENQSQIMYQNGWESIFMIMIIYSQKSLPPNISASSVYFFAAEVFKEHGFARVGRVLNGFDTKQPLPYQLQLVLKLPSLGKQYQLWVNGYLNKIVQNQLIPLCWKHIQLLSSCSFHLHLNMCKHNILLLP